MTSRPAADAGLTNLAPNRHPWGYALLTVLLLSGELAFAQSAPSPSGSFEARIKQAARALETYPRLKKLSEQQRVQRVEFVTGNVLFVLHHEQAHAAVTEFNLPVLGHDEDAADYFAVLRGLSFGSTFSHRVLVEAAKGWFMSDRRDRQDGEAFAYYDEHSLDKQRAYNIVCLMVGSDPAKFKDLADETKLPAYRKETCPKDYARISRSWATLLQPHLRAADQPKTKIDVIYGEGKGNLEVFAQGFRAMRLLETVAENVENFLAWSTPFTMEMQTCGYVNSAWVAATHKLTLCYELAADFADLYQEFSFEPPASRKQRSK